MNQTQPSQQQPIMVTIGGGPSQQNKDLQGLSDVLIGSLGLTGVLVLGAVVLAAIFGTVLFWIRSRST